MNMNQILDSINQMVWGIPLLTLLLGTGILFTIQLKGIQGSQLKRSVALIFKQEDGLDGDISPFASLCTALAATVGTGNIVGVATAIAAGGPGALFWMWVAAFFGMATKYAEGVLAIKYREMNPSGEYSGGPMYYIVNGMGPRFKPLAVFFCVSGVLVALFGTGTFAQVNAIATSVQSTTGLDKGVVGIILACLVASIIYGGIQNISKVAEKVVPAMATIYFTLCLIIIGLNIELIPTVLSEIVVHAFTPMAAIGGFTGATLSSALRNGVARGVFSNESGLGSAPIAAAAAKCQHPVEQGLVSMFGTFVDSLIICTVTGLSLLVTGVWHDASLSGSLMTEAAFNAVLPSVFGISMGSILVMICLSLFAFTTILGWNYYGERCVVFLVGTKGIRGYRLLFILMVALGGFISLESIWLMADIFNGLMALPNLIALLALRHVVVEQTADYFKHTK